MKIDLNAAYKGTAFGDPAMSLKQNTIKQPEMKLAAKAEAPKAEVKTEKKLEAAAVKNKAAETKGTKVSEAAKMNVQATYTKDNSKQLAQTKGSRFDVSL